jgi:PKD repeat protein
MGIKRARMAIAAAALGLMIAATGASAASADTGYPGATYPVTAGGSPTGSKPESKLWYAGGRWWATMAQSLSGDHHIFGLDQTTHRWSDTGVAADTRSPVRDDALWDPATGKLYIASHTFFSDEKHGGEETPDLSRVGRIWRYSFDAASGTWSPDEGFPRDINTAKTETLVIDRDSTGTLWATWVQVDPVSQQHRVYVNRSADQGVTWTTPAPLPGSPPATGDDVSSVIPFGGDRIGVMYSSETAGAMNTYFAVHRDGDPDSAWAIDEVPTGYDSDDHINLKADSAGRVYAALKTSNTSGSEPLILLMVRDTDGTWTRHVVGTYSNSHTRAIVELDEAADRLDIFATHGQSGGTIVRKSTSLSAPDFAPGIGEVVMDDTGTEKLNDVTSTKQNLTAASGIVVLANDNTTDQYWHAEISGSGSTPLPDAPAAEFTGAPTSGEAPLTVAFQDASTGAPTNWGWSFGDGAKATTQNSTHTYTAPGTYTVALTARNAGGSTTRTRTGYIVVRAPSAPPPGETGPVTGPPAADPAPTRTPSTEQGVAAVQHQDTPAPRTTAAKAPVVRVTVRRLSRSSARLLGTVAVAARTSRLTVQIQTPSGRWVTAHPVVRWSSHTRPRFTVVVKRRSVVTRWRLLLTGTDRAGARLRGLSRTVVLARRAPLRRAT